MQNTRWEFNANHKFLKCKSSKWGNYEKQGQELIGFYIRSSNIGLTSIANVIHLLWHNRSFVNQYCASFEYQWTCYFTLSWRRSLSYRNELQSKPIGWFLYERDLRHKRVQHNIAILDNSLGPFHCWICKSAKVVSTILSYVNGEMCLIYGGYFPEDNFVRGFLFFCVRYFCGLKVLSGVIISEAFQVISGGIVWQHWPEMG